MSQAVNKAVNKATTNEAYHIVGCGDIGRRVVRCLCSGMNNSISAWVKSDQSALRAKALGIEVSCVDLDEPNDEVVGVKARDIFYFSPPPPAGNNDSRIRSFLAGLQTRPRRVVLISTSGVYGDCEGRWIDESEPTKPLADRAKRRLDAEVVLKEWAKDDVEWVILRVPGIYAADRLPIKRLEQTSSLVNIEQAPWTNRVHADDLAALCVAAMRGKTSNQIINISDDAPSTMTEYFLAVAAYAGLPAPPQIPMQQALKAMSEGMRSYMQESRRIRNDKMKQLLGVELRYPDLAAGLAFSGQSGGQNSDQSRR